MKKMIALLLALMMMLSCIGAVAEEAKAFSMPALNIPDFTINSSISVDQEAVMKLLPVLGLPEEFSGIVQTVLPVVSNLGMRISAAGKTGQVELLLKDEEVASAALAISDDSLTFVSDVIPSYVLTLSAETIKQLAEKASSSLNGKLDNLNTEEIKKVVEKYAAEFMNVVQSSVTVGEPEKGEYEIDNVLFNVKVSGMIDVKAITVAAVDMLKKVAQSETFASILSSAGNAADLSKLDEMLAKVENAKEEEIPAVSFEMYSAENEDGTPAESITAVVIRIDSKDEKVGLITVTALLGLIEFEENTIPALKATMEMPASNATLVFAGMVDLSSLMVNVSLDAYIQDQYFGATSVIGLSNEGMHGESALYIQDETNPVLTETTDLLIGVAEVTADFGTEGKTVLSLEELQADQEGQISGGLMMDVLSNGLSNLLNKAMNAMPEEVTKLMNLLMGTDQTAVQE